MEEQHLTLYIQTPTPQSAKTPRNDLQPSKGTAHVISHDPWYQPSFAVMSVFNSAFVLGYSGIIMVPLGWVGGILGFIVSTLLSFYANLLLSRLHETGGIRHIRYRDLAGHIYGKKMYYMTWILQYINLFMINIGFLILAGQAIKAIYTLCSNEAVLKLPYCLAITGFIFSIFALGVPHLSALRLWLGVSAFLILIYILTSIGLCIKNGYDSPPRNYEIPRSRATQIFNFVGAGANYAFIFNTGMLPELQATVKQPSIKNMNKGLFLLFTMGVAPIYIVAIVGYWAYGSSTSSYLLNNVHGPKWVKIIANVAVFLQSMITLHIFASPMYECLDTKFGRSNESWYSIHNWIVRLVARGTYLGGSTFVAALIPFLGDFVNLTGAVGLIPLTFVWANHMYIKVKGKDLNALQKSWHWANVLFFSLLAVAATVAALRFIIIDSNTYHVFADI